MHLLNFFEEVTMKAGRGEEVYIIYLDSKKAFNTTPHQLLMNKVRKYYAKDVILNWIKKCLGYSQRMMVNAYGLHRREVINAVPHRSIVNPFLLAANISERENLQDVSTHGISMQQ